MITMDTGTLAMLGALVFALGVTLALRWWLQAGLCVLALVLNLHFAISISNQQPSFRENLREFQQRYHPQPVPRPVRPELPPDTLTI